MTHGNITAINQQQKVKKRFIATQYHWQVIPERKYKFLRLATSQKPVIAQIEWISKINFFGIWKMQSCIHAQKNSHQFSLYLPVDTIDVLLLLCKEHRLVLRTHRLLEGLTIWHIHEDQKQIWRGKALRESTCLRCLDCSDPAKLNGDLIAVIDNTPIERMRERENQRHGHTREAVWFVICGRYVTQNRVQLSDEFEFVMHECYVTEAKYRFFRECSNLSLSCVINQFANFSNRKHGKMKLRWWSDLPATRNDAADFYWLGYSRIAFLVRTTCRQDHTAAYIRLYRCRDKLSLSVACKRFSDLDRSSTTLSRIRFDLRKETHAWSALQRIRGFRIQIQVIGLTRSRLEPATSSQNIIFTSRERAFVV